MQGRSIYPTSEISALEDVEGHSCGGYKYDQEPEDVLFGREDAEKELVSRLIDSTEENLCVISVVSEEAVGKTALARHVYKRLDIRQHFQCRVWVHVGKEFAYKDLLLVIIKQIPISLLVDIELMREEELRDMVFQTLLKFRFLLVFDDVCKEDAWLKHLRPSADATNGSRVILTTRDNNVALEADPWSSPLNLTELTKEESWVLFLKSLGRRRPENSSDLNNFRERILGICKGLPPAILLLGGLLSMSTLELNEWSSVIDKLEFLESQLPLLALMSYNELPSGVEDKAKTCLEELVSRNMIEIATRKSDGSPKTCRMPCFLYDVLLPKAEEEGFLHVHHHRSDKCPSADSDGFKVERLADHFGVKSTLKCHIRNLCSYFSFNTKKQGASNSEIGMLLKKITSNREIGMLLKKIINGKDYLMLKVLDLEGVYKPRLPEKLCVLRSLKYLGLRWTVLDSCPASIGDLPCLETIDLKHTRITSLPCCVWKGKKLRHVYVNEVSIQKPSEVSSTNQLQTLMGLFIRSKNPNECGLDKFTSLTKLGLTCHSKSKKETAEYISQLGNLQNLRLSSRDPFGQPLDLVLSPMKVHKSLSKLYLFGVIADDDIGNLPRNLKILTLSMSKLKEDPMPVLGELPQLNILRLFSGSYLGSKMTCHRGHFPKLSILKLWNLELLKQWTVEDGAMPQLLELEIRLCKQLKSSDGLEQLPSLKELVLTNMPREFVANVRQGLRRDILLTNTWDFSPLFA